MPLSTASTAESYVLSTALPGAVKPVYETAVLLACQLVAVVGGVVVAVVEKPVVHVGSVRWAPCRTSVLVERVVEREREGERGLKLETGPL